MPDDVTALEHRIDKLESWRSAEVAVKKAKEEAVLTKHTNLQILLSVVSSATMLVNLYLTLYRK